MKKFMIAALMLCCACVNINAQEVSDVEFGAASQALKYNYLTAIEQKMAYQDAIERFEGNDLTPTKYYTEDINGVYGVGFILGNNFAHNFGGGAGLGLGHDYRKWMWEASASASLGTPDKESDDQGFFIQGRADAKIGIKVAQWRAHHNYLTVGLDFSVHLSKYVDNDHIEYTAKETKEDGTVVTHNMAWGEDNIRELTSGIALFARYTFRKAFSAWGGFVEVDGGVQQNIIKNTNKFYPDVRLLIGVEYRLNQHKKFNRYAMQQRGYSEADVWNMRSEMKPYQTPAPAK